MISLATSKIHPTAIIDPSSKIAENVEIGPYVVLGPHVEIGEGTRIGPHSLLEHVTLGKNNLVASNVTLGTAPQDFKYKNETTRLILGDRNIIRENVTMNRGSAASGWTRVGSDCHFLTGSHVGHDAIVSDGATVINFVSIAGHCEIGEYAVLGGYVGLHQHVRIGAYAMIGAASMCGLDVIPFGMTQGDRATLRGVNLLGMRRAGMDRNEVSAVKKAYPALFFSGATLEEASAKLRQENPSSAVKRILDFIDSSKRGIMRPIAPGSLGADEKVTV